MSQRRQASWWTVGALSLFVVTLIKMGAVVFSSPIIAYANNYDFVRQEACIGVWQDYPDRAKTEANKEWPVNRLKFDGQRRKDLCTVSIDNLFGYLPTRWHTVGDSIDFREISALKVLAVGLSVGGLLTLISSPAVRFAGALAFFLVFGDVAYLSYFNTFYAEVSAIAGAFLSILGTAWLLSHDRAPHGRVLGIGVLALIWLGLSKQQYNPLASVLALILALAAWRAWSRPRVTGWLVTLAIALPVVYGLANRVDHSLHKSINAANKTNTFFQAVLPEAADKRGAVRQLGLPDRCIEMVGLSWYSPGVSDKHPCPEVAGVSRAKLIGLFAVEPHTFVEPMRRGTHLAMSYYLTYIGRVEDASILGTLRYRVVQATSLSVVLKQIPEGLYTGLAYVSMVCGLLVMLWMAWRLACGRAVGALMAMLGLGGSVTFYAVASSVFGDGYSEVPKHAVGFGIGIACQLGAITMLVLCAVRLKARA